MGYKKTTDILRGLSAPAAIAAVAAIAGWASPAKAYTFNTSPDWQITYDSNVAYAVGIRAQARNPNIADAPTQQNDEYKFPNRGNVTTSRFDYAGELAIEYQNNYGFDFSWAAWKDFAYNGGVPKQPNSAGAGTSNAPLSSNVNGRYPSYTNYWYNQGIELNNAFVFGNFEAANIPFTVKVGRFTEYWGTSLFNGFQAISYSQSPLNLLDAVQSPGTETKDLFMPRGQVSVHAQVLPSLSLAFQYAFEYRPDVFPEGGTFLGVADPLFVGPQSVEGQFARGKDKYPAAVDNNFGVEAVWQPSFINSEFGIVFRQFDDVVPNDVFNTIHQNGHLVSVQQFTSHEKLYGLYVDQNIGLWSTGIETNIRQATALNEGGGAPGNVNPKGNLFNIIANGIYVLQSNPVWQTGNFIAEIAYTRLLGVTSNADEYYGEGDKYAAACNGVNYNLRQQRGCATQSVVNGNILFDPQWLQVFPGVDIDVPLSANFGIWGNGQTVGNSGVANQAASIGYSFGVHALYKQKYNATLKWVAYQAQPGGFTTAGSITGKPYYNGGSGEYMWDDKAQLLLTLATSF